ncbi:MULTISPECIES: hypothetical protein [Burkholderia]|uniref:hypothetical protein n=1 Tax=Burkholderia TaxID=32008 RepID=UPI00048609F1|nr:MULTISPECIES: hypothetical protein [Burkholderia]
MTRALGRAYRLQPQKKRTPRDHRGTTNRPEDRIAILIALALVLILGIGTAWLGHGDAPAAFDAAMAMAKAKAKAKATRRAAIWMANSVSR